MINYFHSENKTILIEILIPLAISVFYALVIWNENKYISQKIF